MNRNITIFFFFILVEAYLNTSLVICILLLQTQMYFDTLIRAIHIMKRNRIIIYYYYYYYYYYSGLE